ncbi:ribonuclease Y [Microgenomates group bacterium RBG_16_45_19]|nr:MAG: ribonuclease Y [Microgenomates group bacterium RBG_16_45_19]
MNQRLLDQQTAFDQKEHELVRQDAVLSEKERYLTKLEQETRRDEEANEKLKKRLVDKLEEVGSMTREQAREQLLQAVEKRSAKDIALKIKATEEQANEEADEKAKEILVDAMRHAATDYVAEYAVSTVELPSEDIKGRLIGKEGRNIRTFERATGVDLDLDEQPGVVRLSSFDSVRREVARQALKRLIADGRIQPTRIEEYVTRAKQDIDKVMFEEGKKLCLAVGAFNVPHELMAILGRFKYRSSYGQNMIAHTLEETKIGLSLAHEVNADVDTVRLGCLLHDIGKVITDEEGSHVDLGVKLLKKYNLPQSVIDCVAQHHEDTAFTTKEAILVYIADAISGARPGARFENYDEYVKRLDTMETIAKNFKGVSEAYAIQAGRELRVLIDPQQLNDDEAVVVADKIRDRIKNEMTYPGTVTVNVIREVRASAVAS